MSKNIKVTKIFLILQKSYKILHNDFTIEIKTVKMMVKKKEEICLFILLIKEERMMKISKMTIVIAISLLAVLLFPLGNVLAEDATAASTILITSEEPKLAPTVDVSSREAVTTSQEPKASTTLATTSQEPLTTAVPITSTVETPSNPTAYVEPNLVANDPSKVIPFLPDLVGTWVNNQNGVTFTIVIRADGSGTTTIDTHDQWKPSTTVFKIEQLEVVSDNLYRYVGGNNWGNIGYNGLGGWGVKYDFGFNYQDGKLQTVFWGAAITDDINYFDLHYGGDFSKTVEQAATPSVEPLSHQLQSQRVKPSLPKTGETSSNLFAVLGFGLLGGIIYFIFKNRKK